MNLKISRALPIWESRWMMVSIRCERISQLNIPRYKDQGKNHAKLSLVKATYNKEHDMPIGDSRRVPPWCSLHISRATLDGPMNPGNLGGCPLTTLEGWMRGISWLDLRSWEFILATLAHGGMQRVVRHYQFKRGYKSWRHSSRSFRSGVTNVPFILGGDEWLDISLSVTDNLFISSFTI